MLTCRVYIIVSECFLCITLFHDLNLDLNLKRHYPSWGTSAYFPRGTSALRPHHSKCCIMIIIIMILYSKTVLHVRARVGAVQCVRTCVRTSVHTYYMYVRICECIRVCVCWQMNARVRLCAHIRGRMCVRECSCACGRSFVCACGWLVWILGMVV